MRWKKTSLSNNLLEGSEAERAVGLAVDDQVVAVRSIGLKVLQIEDMRFLGGD